MPAASSLRAASRRKPIGDDIVASKHACYDRTTDASVFRHRDHLRSGAARTFDPAEEMAALEQIERLHAEGRIKEESTSKMSRIEQAAHPRSCRAGGPSIARAHEVSVVPNDHRLLGFQSQDQGRQGFISSPMISDIVDEDLFAKLIAAGLKDADAKHVMYAVANDCQVFVTLDGRDSCHDVQRLRRSARTYGS